MMRRAAPSDPRAESGDPALPRVLLAFLAVYLIWGSTYLAIRWAIETIPPFTMAGIRFLVAGAILMLWARLRGMPAPNRLQVRDGIVVGALLLLGGNGAVVWAEQWVPSGLTSLLIATVPFWMLILDWVWTGGRRPAPASWLGLAWGLFGVWLLVGRGGMAEIEGPVLLGAAIILAGSFSWALGSIHSRRARIPASPRMATALQMLAGGALLTVAGALTGEWARWSPPETSVRSLLALVYLIVFGGMVAYSAYIWLLRVSTPGRVATYAYVNPVVALLLGWALADEPLTPRMLLAAAIILSAVGLLSLVSPPGGRRTPS
ncbi:MAG: EamA family transporter [Gemmatimonadota bacterium]